MEELVGRWWHQAITKVTRQDHPAAAVQLQDMQKTIGIFFRAAGGPVALRFTPASMQAVGGQR
ncbi:MAG TPA: VWA domain-containing protein, partial [Rhodoferax sp.]|nr:VWA domain-containing protein [Rhodoferax sp.]